jgi:hypothetical protein
MSDLRSTLERGVGGATPPPDGFERMLRRGDRRRRNQRVAAGLVGIAVFVAAIWIVTSGEPAGRGRTPGSSGLTGPTVPGAAGPMGLIGLAPQGATPSTPRRGELVLNLLFGHTMGDPGRFAVHMYADGRLIWARLGDATSNATGLLEQRLTPEGVELVRAEVLSTGLFDHDLYLTNAYGLFFGQIEVRDGDRLVRVTWGDCCDPSTADIPRETPTPEQASALQRLDARLADPASWLPTTAWADPEIKPYVPYGYSVCYEGRLGIGLDRVLASFPHAAENLLRTWDRTHAELIHEAFPGTSLDIWCSSVTDDEARALAQTLDAGGGTGIADVFGLRYEFGQRDPGAADVSLSIEARLPHEV